MQRVAKLAVFALLFGALQVIPAVAGPPAGAAMERFIVVLDGDAPVRPMAERAMQATGGQVGFVYENSIKGFSIEMPAAALNGLRNMPGVASIERDVVIAIAAEQPSTAYDRIEQDLNPAGLDYSGVDIAILDTGVWYDATAGVSHQDLNLRWVTDCTSAILYPLFGGCSGGGNDGNGHGTHVAGIAAACDNEIGSIGAAPCATLWSFKVLGDDGTGFLGSILAGIDLVAANADQIEVANMSLGFEGESQALADAVDAAVAQGIVFTVAAGNSSIDAAGFMPAAVQSAITVSSVTDFDGAPGGLGAMTCRNSADDVLADYSNFGSVVDIAAPGSCIFSTHLNNGYATYSGTSMASPTVAGAAARYLHDNGIDPTSAADVQATRNALVAGGFAQAGPCGFSGDTDGFAEPLLSVNGAPFGGDGSCETGAPPPSAPPVAVISASDCVELVCSFDGSTSTDDVGIVGYSWDFGDGNTATGPTASHTYATGATYTVSLTVEDGDGQTNTTTVTVSPSGPPPPNAPPTAMITSASCTDLDCSFDGSGSTDDVGIVSYTWDFGDGSTGSGATASHSYAAAGTYIVTLTVADAEGLTDTATTSVTATDPPPPPPPGDIQMTTGVAGFLFDEATGIATVQFYVLAIDGSPVVGAEATGVWSWTDRRDRTRTKTVTGVSDGAGMVTIETRFRNGTPVEFCVTDITAPGYVYVDSGLSCGGRIA